jgi:hypothetical protein
MSVSNKIREIGPADIPVVTTTKQRNGAIAMFYPGVKEKLAELFGGNYYVAFTSVDDARIHAKGTISPIDILSRLKDVNDHFPKEDILSRKVFFYDAAKKVFDTLEL